MDSSSGYSPLCSNKHHLFSGPEMAGGSSSFPSSCSWDSGKQKRQRSSVSYEYDNEPASGMAIGKNSPDCKDKKPVGYDTDFQKQVKNASSEDLTGSSTDNMLEFDDLEVAQKSAGPDDSNLSNIYDDYYED